MKILSDLSDQPLRGLSVAGPFPWLLAKGKKEIELRSWATSHRGVVLLHASSGSDYNHLFKRFKMRRSDCPKFAIVGAAKLTGCICYDRPSKWQADLSRHRWAGHETYEEVIDLYGKPPFGHIFENAIAFENPILDVPGAFNYWLPKNERQKVGFQKAIALLQSSDYLS